MSRIKKALLAVMAFLALAGCCLFPCVNEQRDDDPSMGSAVSVHGLGLALCNYHKQFGRLPPRVVSDKNGNPLYSWRVLLLPYLDHQDIYKQFKLDEPWNSPHNKLLANETPYAFTPAVPFVTNDAPGLTRYQVLVGPGTAFERPGLTFNDFPDGLQNTILVVEAKEPVPWSKPVDLNYDPNGPLPDLECEYRKPIRFLYCGVGGRRGFNAAFADGASRFIRSDTDESIIRALITRNGGENVRRVDLD